MLFPQVMSYNSKTEPTPSWTPDRCLLDLSRAVTDHTCDPITRDVSKDEPVAALPVHINSGDGWNFRAQLSSTLKSNPDLIYPQNDWALFFKFVCFCSPTGVVTSPHSRLCCLHLDCSHPANQFPATHIIRPSPASQPHTKSSESRQTEGFWSFKVALTIAK